MLGMRAPEEAVGLRSVIANEPADVAQVLDLVGLESEQPSSLADLEHPVTAYLNGLAPSSRRPQLAALEAIARRSTRVFSAETRPRQRLRRPHVLKIRSLLEENYLPATANRMLSALRGVLKECWRSGLLGMEEYRLAVDVEPVRGESEPRKERVRKVGIQPPAPHDLRRTWTGDLLEAGVELATVQKMAGHASVSTTGRYDRRDRGVQRRAAAHLDVPYVPPLD